MGSLSDLANMDLEEIGHKLSNLTFYDLKQFYTQAKNYALNISEIEAKVREATNDDPWGASSTLMQEIAQAHDFHEIMPTIFRRFVEKEAKDWRQIYKALQLLEYLVKNGAEKVVDEARAHLATIKILRNFHYIDEQGKDQGINIRNRAKELAALLSDVDMIRAERRKARANRSKYQGTGNADFVPGSGSGRYGGFSSDSYYASGGASGTYGVSGASTHEQEYEEYDAGDDEDTQGPSHTAAPSTKAGGPPVADLFSFDDESTPAAPSKPAAPAAAAPLDDFDDFQTAPAAPSQTAAAQNDPMFDFLDIKPSTPAAAPKPATTVAPPKAAPAPAPAKPVTPAAPPKPSASLFDDLWAESRGKSSAPEGSGKKTMAQLAQDQTSSRVWASSAPKPKAGGSNDLFDLL
ncbi:Epsin-3, clathrin recruitment and traffic between the Golgi and endosome [Malassezia caprae]|uniref:Epsin-3, clathrin recruitment and traffic between the Golgi and endosome n=1 Tax=Malassezia caprae TaxID=1381934 RepID=A0AAF0E4M2_9BASI|nr:Epsin-3, clathrin recruitment and traffic between the Golgi and endosome [Malassezia caprae]